MTQKIPLLDRERERIQGLKALFGEVVVRFDPKTQKWRIKIPRRTLRGHDRWGEGESLEEALTDALLGR